MDWTLLGKDILMMAIETGVLGLIGIGFQWMRQSKNATLNALANQQNEQAAKSLARKAIDSTEEWAHGVMKAGENPPAPMEKLQRATNMVIEGSMGSPVMGNLTEQAAMNEVLAELKRGR